MSVLSYLKNVFKNAKSNVYELWMTNSIPIFTSFGENIYLSDFVNNAIDRVATEISKIEIKSVVENKETINVQKR